MTDTKAATPSIPKTTPKTICTAPKDWKLVSQMAQDKDVSPCTIKAKIAALGNLESKKCFTEQGVPRTYYSPKSVAIIYDSLSEILSIQRAPDDWKTIPQMAKDFNVSIPTIRKKVMTLDDLETRKFKNWKGVTCPFYSPNSVKSIRNALGDMLSAKKPPKDWKLMPHMEADWGISKYTIRKKAAALGNLETREFLNPTGKMRVYYSPTSVEIIRKSLDDLISAEEAPEGWMLVYQMVEEFKVSDRIIKMIIATSDNLQTKMFLDKLKRVKAHYSPESVAIIHKTVNEYKNNASKRFDVIKKFGIISKSTDDNKMAELAPDGWELVYQIQLATGVHSNTIRKIISGMKHLTSKKYESSRGAMRDFYSPESVAMIKDALAKYKFAQIDAKESKSFKSAPEGYKTIFGMAIEWKTSSRKVKAAITAIGTLQPQRFLDFRGVSHLYYSSQDIETIYDTISDYMTAKKAPKDWLVVRQIALKWNINVYQIQQAIQKLDKSSKSECKKCLDDKGRLRTFYSPQAVAAIYDTIFSVGKAPDGYMLVFHMEKAWKISKSKIRETIKELGDLESLTLGFGKKNKLVYYSPKAIETIRYALHDFSSIEQAPDDWRTTYQMAEDFGISVNAIHSRIKKLKNLKVKKYKNQRGAAHLFYSPDAICAIRNSLNKPRTHPKPKTSPQIPGDWISASKIASDHKVSLSAIKKAAEKLDDLDSMQYCDEHNAIKMYYSPKSAALVSNEVELLKNTMKAPCGWRTLTMIANELGVAVSIIQHQIVQTGNFEKKHYLDYRGSVQPFYSPDAFKAIRGALITEQAPDGWKTVPQMSLDYNVTSQAIRYHINNMKNPKSKKYRNENERICSFYSPEVVAIVRKSIKHD